VANSRSLLGLHYYGCQRCGSRSKLLCNPYTRLNLTNIDLGSHSICRLCLSLLREFEQNLIYQQLQEYYHLSYTVVSLLFLSPLVGYTASALLNNMVHLKWGQRGVAIICPLCHLVAYISAATHPPFPVIVIFFTLAGFGNGLEDAAWNAWVGNMANNNEVLGFLHGFYGLGATISPLIATTMITKANLTWYHYYQYIMVSTFTYLCNRNNH
jgi:fucose permease